MTLNTRDKRGSAIGVGLPFRHVLPNPDPQAEDQADRQQLEFLYRGILAININVLFKGPMDVLIGDAFRQLDVGVPGLFLNGNSRIGLDAGSPGIYAVNVGSRIKVEL
jgi:hypothetical protein